jgi:FkbM family methyltransferase
MDWPSKIVDTDVGPLALHADDRVMTPFISEHHHWEPDEAAWLRSVLAPGQTVVDVGANVGYFTVLMSHAVGPEGTVVAVEPEEGNLALLDANLRRNGCENVRVVRAAAWDRAGTLALRRSAVNAGDHQVHPAGGGDVPCVALDDVLEGAAVDVVKIDTQGADHYVVLGLARTLRASPRARLLIEFWMDSMFERSVSAEDVLVIYRALGRPIGLLQAGGHVRWVDDHEVLATAHAAQDHWVNLVLDITRSAPS